MLTTRQPTWIVQQLSWVEPLVALVTEASEPQNIEQGISDYEVKESLDALPGGRSTVAQAVLPLPFSIREFLVSYSAVFCRVLNSHGFRLSCDELFDQAPMFVAGEVVT